MINRTAIQQWSEINCFEHFNVLGLTKVPFRMENSWFTGEAELTTYHFKELLGTKLRTYR